MQPVTNNSYALESKNCFAHVYRTEGYRLCIFGECDMYLVNNYLKTSAILNCVTNGV